MGPGWLCVGGECDASSTRQKKTKKIKWKDIIVLYMLCHQVHITLLHHFSFHPPFWSLLAFRIGWCYNCSLAGGKTILTANKAYPSASPPPTAAAACHTKTICSLQWGKLCFSSFFFGAHETSSKKLFMNFNYFNALLLVVLLCGELLAAAMWWFFAALFFSTSQRMCRLGMDVQCICWGMN